MMEKVDDYFLNVNWSDLDKNTHRVGFFIIYNQKFYFKIRGKESIPRAYDQGFAGRPGVLPDKIYASYNEVFDTLKKVLGIKENEKDNVKIMKEILGNIIENDETLENRRDRISIEAMNEREIEECKKEIDEVEQTKNKATDTER